MGVLLLLVVVRVGGLWLLRAGVCIAHPECAIRRRYRVSVVMNPPWLLSRLSLPCGVRS